MHVATPFFLVAAKGKALDHLQCKRPHLLKDWWEQEHVGAAQTLVSALVQNRASFAKQENNSLTSGGNLKSSEASTYREK